MPVPLVLAGLGAAAGWAAYQWQSDIEGRRRRFPFVHYDWWKPRDRFLMVKLGVLRKLRDLSRQAEVCRAYIDEHPDHPLGYTLLIGVKSTQGRWDEARALVTALLLIEPDSSVGHWDAAMCALQLGDFSATRRHLERFVALEPDSILVPVAKTRLTYLENRSRGAPPASRPKRPRKPAAKKKAARAKAPRS